LITFEPDRFARNRTVVQRLCSARVRGATIYIAGNGGSASTASHWVNDLGKATKNPAKKSIKVMSLNDNVSWLTALANDEGYDRVFSGQLENFADEIKIQFEWSRTFLLSNSTAWQYARENHTREKFAEEYRENDVEILTTYRIVDAARNNGVHP
jgi:hypothetical protein